MSPQKGFLLLEVLIVMLILAVAFVSFMGVIGQTLRVSVKAREVSEAISQYDALLFELESGMSPDLASFGGRGELEGGYQYEIKTDEMNEAYQFLESKMSWKEGREFLNLKILVPEAPAQ
jgi:prepilin-type N-terminal cleavage/methylation domain-containing protein